MERIMELYLIRHGQSTNNAELAHVADPPLSNLGKQQAYYAGKALQREGISRLYCSPMLRALQTAEIIGGILSLAPHIYIGLHEWDGIWEESVGRFGATLPGLTRSEMKEVCPDVILPQEVTDKGWLFTQWENVELMLQRADQNATNFIVHLEATHAEADGRVAAISHGGFLSTLIGTFFSLPPNDDSDRFAHHNAAISKIRRTPRGTQLRYSDRICHLPKGMITS
jgi:broad specificity phosphatase PhoE